MYNYTTTARMGETGFVITTQLFDENGAVDLTAWVGITMDIKTTKGVEIVTAHPSTITDVTTGLITNTLDITTVAFPNMTDGAHRIVFTATDQAGDLHTFPKSKRHPFGTLLVLEAL